jgi:Ca2+-binding RTX toxin-like protein
MFESLESRRLMSAYITSGVLVVTGGENADTISVNRLIDGSFRVEENGTIRSYIGVTASLVTSIYVDGGFGDDKISVGGTTLTTKLIGGDGNDVIYGSSGPDSIFGGAGNDTLFGNSGADNLYGDGGRDSLEGGDGNDTLNGGIGNDTLRGDSGNDQLVGSSGADKLYGFTGNDQLDGGNGNDYLHAGSGNDSLYGGSGIDTLLGEAGRDALLGGPNNDADSVTGGSGQDRFLEWSSTSSGAYEKRTDVKSEDAVIYFRNAAAQNLTLGSGIGLSTYTTGTWSQEEIKAVDTALETLQTKTNNTKLLKTNLGTELTFKRAGSTTHERPASGWNSGFGSVTISEHGVDTARDIQSVAIHEIGHNWDEESPFYNHWKALSGWEQSPTAQFARDYGKMNPLEDWATMWEAYFNFGGTERVPAKMTHLNTFFNHMAAVA